MTTHSHSAPAFPTPPLPTPTPLPAPKPPPSTPAQTTAATATSYVHSAHRRYHPVIRWRVTSCCLGICCCTCPCCLTAFTPPPASLPSVSASSAPTSPSTAGPLSTANSGDGAHRDNLDVQTTQIFLTVNRQKRLTPEQV